MLTALLLVALAAPQKVVLNRPDVLILALDDVADSDIDLVATPNIHALAASGVRFRRAYAHAWCAPTRDSLEHSITLGKSHGDDCAPVAATAVNLAWPSIGHLFNDRGYRTAHFGKWHEGSDLTGSWISAAARQGYDYVRTTHPVGTECNVPGSGVKTINDGVVSTVVGNDTIRQRDSLLAWWTATPSPRFAIVSFAAPHAPFVTPPPEILPPGHVAGATNRERYEDELEGFDFVLGQILAAIPPNTYVILLGDNGTPGNVPGESPVGKSSAARADQDPWRLKLTCYEDGVRVPLIVRDPGGCPIESDSLVHVVDLLPTLADILNAPVDPAWQGQSFLPCLSGLPGPRDSVFVWSPPRVDMAMIGPRWKLLTNPAGIEVLYDLSTDPLELNPLSPTGPDADALRAERDAILAGG